LKQILNSISPVAATIIWAVVILILSTVGVGVNIPSSWQDVFSWDKLAHAAVYFILCYFLHQSFITRKPTLTSNIYAFLISTSYGILIEIVQYSFFPDRYFELLDILANIVGTIASLSFIYFLIIKKSQSYG